MTCIYVTSANLNSMTQGWTQTMDQFHDKFHKGLMTDADFNMRRKFYEESKKRKLTKKIKCPGCGSVEDTRLPVLIASQLDPDYEFCEKCKKKMGF